MGNSPPSLENLKPALAGAIVDDEFGEREAFATFIHLVERDYISFKKSGNKTKFYSTSKDTSPLETYEAMLLPPKSGVDDVTAGSMICDIADNEAFKSSVMSHAQSLGLISGKDSAYIFNVGPASFLTQKKTIITALIFILSFLIVLWFPDALAGRLPNGSQVAFILFLCIPVAISLAFNLFEERQNAKLADSSYSKYGEEQKARYLALYKWLKDHPLNEARWANEFLPYSIAFGLYREYYKFPK